MKCPICNKELKIMRETIVDETTVEVIGACENGEYDGLWFAEKDEHGNVTREYGHMKYWQG